ncbi:MAG: ABC transporter ATP-binding protein [Halanaerobiales bacterium]
MIEAKNIDYAYQNSNVLKNVNLVADRGELTCLLGANGSGKTTILKLMNGILKQDRGEIVIDGKDLSELKRKEIARLVSMVPQEHRAVFSYDSRDVVAMGVTPYLQRGRQPEPEVYSKAEKLMDKLNIGHLAYRSYNNLSGGERQLVLIGRALMQDTDYLLMDEPTSHLDFKNQHLILWKLRELARAGRGVVTALHDPNLALKFCDKVILIREGKVLAQGPVSEIMTDQNLGLAYDIEIQVDRAKRGVEIAWEKNSLSG